MRVKGEAAGFQSRDGVSVVTAESDRSTLGHVSSGVAMGAGPGSEQSS